MTERTVALAGNPNVGKSTVFNALTGLRQHTGNWPGKTVEVARGSFRLGEQRVQMVDLPGTYSLEGISEDERIAGEFIERGNYDCVVAVCDATALERTLILAIQILQRTQAVILCVNLMDEAKRRGIHVDSEKLSQLLGVPVVLTAAAGKAGLVQLKAALANLEQLRFHTKKWDDPVRSAAEIAAQVVTGGREENWQVILDRILVSRRRGIPILLMLIFLIVFITVSGANYPSMLLEMVFEYGYHWMRSITGWMPWWLSGILLDGVYATSARVIAVMLPPMAIFFPLFTLLEDVGYLPRMAFLLDGMMDKFGGCGRQALTLCMGIGCNAVGVMGCRIIDTPKQRLSAILTNAMIPCNGRFPSLILLASLILPPAISGLAVGGFVVLGVLGAMVTTGLLSKTALRHDHTPFLMELPPFRKPRLGHILLRSVLDRTLKVAGRALVVAAPAGGVLWLLGELALLVKLSYFLELPGVVLGMNGVILLAFILSVPANELLIPIMILIAGETVMHGLSLQTVLCTMIFTVFHWPCATTLLTVRKETGSYGKTAAAVLLPTAVGAMLCLMINLLL